MCERLSVVRDRFSVMYAWLGVMYEWFSVMYACLTVICAWLVVMCEWLCAGRERLGTACEWRSMPQKQVLPAADCLGLSWKCDAALADRLIDAIDFTRGLNEPMQRSCDQVRTPWVPSPSLQRQ